MQFTITIFHKVKLIISILDFDFTDGDVEISIKFAWK